MFDIFINFLVDGVSTIGYFGVYLYMVLVGTFIPVPSELVLLPAGYLSSKGEMNFFLLLLSGSLGSLSGAFINYFFAKIIIKKVLKNKRMFVAKVIKFFRSHGKISVLVGPLTPGLGQYISLPAGISHMKFRYFVPLTYTANIIWVGFMLMIGYLFGDNTNEAHLRAVQGSLVLFAVVIVISIVYVVLTFKRRGRVEI